MVRRVEEFEGRLVDFTGDNFLAEFASATAAVSCAIAIQDDLGGSNSGRPPEDRMEFRLGVHLGEVRVEGDRIYGDGVNVASRLEALAEPGGICLSAAVHDQVRSKVDRTFVEAGSRSLKNVPQPITVYRSRGTAGAIPASARSRSATVVRLAVTVVVVAAAVAIAAWRSRVAPGPAPPPDPESPIRSLAVLPLQNLSADPDQAYFADGMTDTLIGVLAKFSDLRVISRTSVMRYRGSRPPLAEIAEELGVDAVVEGTVARDGDRVRISARLIDARSDLLLWADSYERELSGIFEVQAEVARGIATGIDLELSPQTATVLSAAPDDDPRALEAFLRGQSLWRRFRPSDVREALEAFQTAVRLEPTFAEAHAGIARCYNILSAPLGEMPFAEGMELTRAAAERAVSLDPTVPQAHLQLGFVALMADWDLTAARRHVDRGRALGRSVPEAYVFHGFVQRASGEYAAAVATLEEAIRTGPADPANWAMYGESLRELGRQDDGLRAIELALELNPEMSYALEQAQLLHEEQGRFEAAAELQERRLRAAGVPEPRAAALREAAVGGASAYWTARRSLLEDDPPSNDYWYAIARTHGLEGDLDRAFDCLDRALDSRARGLLVNMARNPFIESLRPDPRFADLERRIAAAIR
ncbi:MAG: adenylate/guanylate cyclase domain-containing protein [Thermoanaerobaculia bacterium]|nr:adenylate/guanylate cyclase domain-containing protein [Thermoanaerobaculia bacterium]